MTLAAVRRTAAPAASPTHHHWGAAVIWLDTLVQGILLGGLYALFAAGLSLVFGIMRLVNLAHGDLIVFAAYLVLVGVTRLGLSPWVAALLAAPLMFALGWLLQRPSS